MFLGWVCGLCLLLVLLAGRKISILGDTCNARPALDLIKDSDVLVHECTLASFPEDGKFTQDAHSTVATSAEKNMAASAAKRGHSTPIMVGKFAKEANCQQLLLNHFGSNIMQRQEFRYVKDRVSTISGLAMGKVITTADGWVVDLGGGS